MCTSIVVNRKKTIVGWNLDLLDMEHRVRAADDGVYIEINDAKEGWLPLFGANGRGDFVGMPTCWPYDKRSDPAGEGENVMALDIDLLLQRKTLQEVRTIAETSTVYSLPGVTFMSALSDADGNVVYIIPGQGTLCYERPAYKILTNFSPFKQDAETHPWMGWDRYQTAEAMLRDAPDDFDVEDCFKVLRAVAQEACPTVVSMVFDVGERTAYWCEDRNWDKVHRHILKPSSEGRTTMQVINFFDSDDRQHWLDELGRSDWRAGAFLRDLLRKGTFFDAVGEHSRVLLLTDGDELISFCTYAEKDDIQPTELTPWVGFVYTFPAHRGRRWAGRLFDEVERLAREEGVREVYLSTNHVGLYEKYGWEYKTVLNDMDGQPSRVYAKRIETVK